MHKNKRVLKATLFSLVLAATLLPASNLSAQNGGGVFGRGGTDAGNRAGESFTLRNQSFSVGSYGITNQGFGVGSYGITNQSFNVTEDGVGGITNQSFDVPLGSGLLLLVGASLGYAALLKKKED